MPGAGAEEGTVGGLKQRSLDELRMKTENSETEVTEGTAHTGGIAVEGHETEEKREWEKPQQHAERGRLRFCRRTQDA